MQPRGLQTWISESFLALIAGLVVFTGQDFVTGLVLYDGEQALSFGDGLWAVTLAAL